MERVEFQQEQMLAELKDLVERNLFTEQETKIILKKRTAFETALVRRVAKKADFLRYAAFERGLEDLRRKRVERMREFDPDRRTLLLTHLETETGRGPTSISDYALVQRQFNIFERALKKFKADVGLWIQYIELAKKEKAKALVGRITARALQMHPNEPSLYILAADHELSHNSPSTARTLLQRGLRINKDSIDLWKEYVKMEMGWVESLRRRWGVLGIDDNEGDDEEGASRKEIMQGGIVKSVISNASQELPKIELFSSLEELILHYPSTQQLKESVLSHLHATLRESLPRLKQGKGKAVRLLANSHLPDESVSVEGMQKACEEFCRVVPKDDEVIVAFTEFYEDWSGSMIDENLKLYVYGALKRYTRI